MSTDGDENSFKNRMAVAAAAAKEETLSFHLEQERIEAEERAAAHHQNMAVGVEC
jgi:hypothetical protein